MVRCSHAVCGFSKVGLLLVGCGAAQEHKRSDASVGPDSSQDLDGNITDSAADAPTQTDGGLPPGCRGFEDPTAIAFEDITETLDLPEAAFWECVLVQDLDGDGANDMLFLVPSSMEILWGDGLGSFERQSVAVDTQIPNSPFLRGCLAVDLDSDGLRELIISNGAAPLLLQHGPARSFTDDTARLGDVGTGASRAMGMADVDGDERLDLYIGKDYPAPKDFKNGFDCDETATDIRCYLPSEPTDLGPDLLLRQQEDGSFAPAPEFALEDPGLILALGIVELTGDSQPDFLVANDFGQNGLYLSKGDSYQEVSAAWNLDSYNHAMGVAFSDLNLDGLWDLYITDIGPDQLYFGTGESFRPVDADSGLADVTRNHFGWGVVAEDLDNDGDPDLAVSNSYIAVAGELVEMLESPISAENTAAHAAPEQSDYLMENCGNERFAFFELPLEDSEPDLVHSALVGGDLDGDGGIDLVEYYPRGHVRILRNSSAQRGNFIKLRLLGREPNRDAVGATVIVDAGGQRQLRQVQLASTGGHGTTEIHAGLGALDRADVTVTWADGSTTVRKEISAGEVTVIEQD